MDCSCENLPYKKEMFDVIILLDVLEHLYDPWVVFSNVLKYLKVGGNMITSIPNFRNYETIRNYIKGDFKYQESGLYDKTHLRFFYKKNILNFYSSNNLEICNIKKNYSGPTFLKKYFNNFTLKIFDELFVLQYLISGKKV